MWSARLSKKFTALSTSKVHASNFSRVGVIGLGLMGHGVAQVIAQAGYQVVAIDSNQDAVDHGMKRIEGSLSKIISKEVAKGKISEDDSKKVIKGTLNRFTTGTDIAAAKDCDLVIEAIAENMELKLTFYEHLGKIIRSDAIFASNTSSLPITAMGKMSGRPHQFVGLHFFNPVQIMKLVEVIRTEDTSPDVFDKMMEFSKSIGKTPVKCKDTPGFIVNRLLVPYIMQALALVDRGDASIEDIDISMQLGAGHPMGPIQLADYVGLDTMHAIIVGWEQNYPDEPAFFMPECLDELVSQGKFGRKTGQGFYTWEGDKIKKS